MVTLPDDGRNIACSPFARADYPGYSAICSLCFRLSTKPSKRQSTTCRAQCCMRQSHKSLSLRAGGGERRGSILDMTSSHKCSVEGDEQLVPGHWEGSLAKGARNTSIIGALIKRTLCFVTLHSRATQTLRPLWPVSVRRTAVLMHNGVLSSLTIMGVRLPSMLFWLRRPKCASIWPPPPSAESTKTPMACYPEFSDKDLSIRLFLERTEYRCLATPCPTT